MSNFRAGQWLVLLLIYYTVYFLIVFSVISAKTSLYISDPNANYTDPGFQRITEFVQYGGKCSTPMDMTTGIFVLLCPQLNSNNYTCNLIDGCEWSDDRVWANPWTWKAWYNPFSSNGSALCHGFVNLTAYGWYPDNITKNKICTDQKNETYCDLFTCTWSNTSEIYASSTVNPFKVFGTFYESVNFMTGFKTDLGLTQFQWIFALFFTYLPALLFFYALYMAIRGGL